MKEVSELIRGEMAAVQSIDAILGKLNNESERSELSSIRMDHVRAVDTLKRFASGSDFSAGTETGGPWVTFAKSFTGGASFFGDKAALQALKIGEEHGLNEYKEALREEGVDMAIKDVIRSELLPNQERHLSVIDRYLH